jgi:hypothetical protein
MYQVVHRPHDLGDRRLRVVAMAKVEIQVVDSDAAQRALHRFMMCLRLRPRSVTASLIGPEELARDDQVLAA